MGIHITRCVACRVVIPDLGNLEAEVEAVELSSRAVNPESINPQEYVQRGATITCRCVKLRSGVHEPGPACSAPGHHPCRPR